jgi:hypothetical protein
MTKSGKNRLIKAAGTKRKKTSASATKAWTYFDYPTFPPQTAQQKRHKIVNALLQGITSAIGGEKIGTRFMPRGSQRQIEALKLLADWLREDIAPPKDILTALADTLDPLSNHKDVPQKFVLQFRKEGIGKNHFVRTAKSDELTRRLVNLAAHKNPNHLLKTITEKECVIAETSGVEKGQIHRMRKAAEKRLRRQP